MAHFVVETTDDERKKVLDVLKQTEGRIVPVRELAEMAEMSQSRVRYAIIDLVDAKKVERVPHKAFNKHYVRYSYKVL